MPQSIDIQIGQINESLSTYNKTSANWLINNDSILQDYSLGILQIEDELVVEAIDHLFENTDYFEGLITRAECLSYEGEGYCGALVLEIICDH